MRTAVVRGGADSVRQVAVYMPGNYRVRLDVPEEIPADTQGMVRNSHGDLGWIVIEGEDRAGWTLDEYVIPRLASGLIFAEETEAPALDLDHPDRDYLDEDGEVNRCAQCGRVIYYDLTDDNYHHDTEPEKGCFLIPVEVRP